MKPAIRFILSYVAFGLGAFPAVAETLSFSQVWDKVSRSSLAQEGAGLKIQAAEEGKSRAARHWLPKVYLDARTYKTNDPGSGFFGLLEQRKVGTQDFAPDSLNHPSSSTFTRGALGLDLALYEGGMKQSQVAVYDHVLAAEQMASSQLQLEQYSQSGIAYGSVAILRRQRERLTALNAQVTKLMNGYQLGQKTNPVGYSGLLGMKSIALRVTGLVEQLDAQEKASVGLLAEMGVEDKNWSPQEIKAQKFVDQYFLQAEKSAREGSYRTLAANENVKAAERAAKMERARYLPKVGAFGESYIFNGDRDTANGYTAGLYLQWNLFNPADYGAYRESRLKAMAADRLNRASIQQENIERSALAESTRALGANLVRLEEGESLLAEQSQISSTLFKNGSISALQFVEILNRRVDLIQQQTDAELTLIKTAGALITKSKTNIPRESSPGGTN